MASLEICIAQNDVTRADFYLHGDELSKDYLHKNPEMASILTENDSLVLIRKNYF